MAAWSPWALPLAQFAGWPPAARRGQAGRAKPAAGAHLSCSAWGFGWDAADPVVALHSSQLWALRPKAAGIFGWKKENQPAAASEGDGYTAGP